MNAKKILVFLLSCLMVVSCFGGTMVAFAEEDKFAPVNEEKIQMYADKTGNPLGDYGYEKYFGAKVTVPEGQRLNAIEFYSFATYSSNVNRVVFRVYQWNESLSESLKGSVLASFTLVNHQDNLGLRVSFPNTRNLTGELVWIATNEYQDSHITPWKATGAPEGNDVRYFTNGSTCEPFCFDMIVSDALTETPATYTATFMADGKEVAKVPFYEGDTALDWVPACPEKEGFYADWEEYTVNNADITVNAVYTDASDAVSSEIADAANVSAFAEEHISYLRGESCQVKYNRDGSVSFVGTWGEEDDIDAFVNIQYLQLMKKYFTGYSGMNDLPNKSHKYNVIALKVVAPAVAKDSTPSMSVTVGRNTEIWGVEIANEIKCDGNEEYWIFDFSDKSDFSSDIINSIKLNWAYSLGAEENLGAEFKLLGFQFFDSLEDALNATGGEEVTEKPTEEPTEKPTEEPTEAPTAEAPSTGEVTEAPKESGCGSVIGFGAVAVLTAAATAVALKKKEN